MDELEGAEIGQAWLEAIIDKLGIRGRPGAEVKVERVKDTNVTTLWFKHQPVAVMVRQRNDHNWTCTTMIDVEPLLEPDQLKRA